MKAVDSNKVLCRQVGLSSQKRIEQDTVSVEEVELPTLTKLADVILELSDMPAKKMRSALRDIAISLRRLEDK